MTATNSTPFLIIGAGIGGAAAALALARQGRRALVLEQAPKIGEIGAGIQLAPNALRVLDTLGVLDEVYDEAVFPSAATIRDATSGEVLTRLDFDAEFVRRFGYPYIVTHRSDLHASLISAVAATGLVELRTDAQVVGLHRVDAERVEVEMAHGAPVVAGAVIGADGLHSVVREYVTGGDELCQLGDFAYRGTVAYDEIPDREGKDDVTWWVGPSMHLMQYPLRRKELYNQVAVFTSDRVGDPEAWGGPDELDRRFADKHELVQQGVSLVDRDRHWAMVDRAPVKPWTRDRVTLLGDAAHPMVQYLAQGGCQALEDALCLAASVTERAGQGLGVEAGFKNYESLRVPRTATVQTWARTMGEVVHADGVPAMLRDELLRTRESKDLPQVEWLYAHRVGPVADALNGA